jgi:hypothetical protein
MNPGKDLSKKPLNKIIAQGINNLLADVQARNLKIHDLLDVKLVLN